MINISDDMLCLIDSERKIKYVIVDIIQGISKRWIVSIVQPVSYSVENGQITVTKSMNRGNFYVEKDFKNREYITIDNIDYYLDDFHKGVIKEFNKPVEIYKRLGTK